MRPEVLQGHCAAAARKIPCDFGETTGVAVELEEERDGAGEALLSGGWRVVRLPR